MSAEGCPSLVAGIYIGGQGMGAGGKDGGWAVELAAYSRNELTHIVYATRRVSPNHWLIRLRLHWLLSFVIGEGAAHVRLAANALLVPGIHWTCIVGDRYFGRVRTSLGLIILAFV